MTGGGGPETPGSADQRASGANLVRGAGGALAVRVWQIAANLLVNALLARLLAPPEVGIYFIVAGIVAGAAPLVALGQGLAVLRRVSGHLARDEEALARGAAVTSLRVAAAGAVAAGAATASIIAFAPQTWPLPPATAGAIAGCIISASLGTVVAELLRANHRIGAATAFGGAVAQTTLLLALAGALATATRMTLVASIWTTAAAQALSLIVAGTLLAPWLRGPRSLQGPPLLSEGLPLAGYAAFAFLFAQVDLWVAGRCIGADAAALYGAAMRLVALVTLPLALVNAALPPLISRCHALGDRRRLEALLRDSATVAAIPAAVGLLVLLVAGGDILSLVFGEHYRSAAAILRWLSVGQLVNVACGSCGFTLAMTGHQRALAWITGAAAVILTAAAAWTVPHFGTAGVAASAALALAAWNAVATLLVRHLEGVWTVARPSDVAGAWRRLHESRSESTA